MEVNKEAMKPAKSAFDLIREFLLLKIRKIIILRREGGISVI
ncbi:MAG: hypothetical protein WBF28_03025 [Atribacterota bacterium]